MAEEIKSEGVQDHVKVEDNAGDDGRQAVTKGAAGPDEADLVVGHPHLGKHIIIITNIMIIVIIWVVEDA